MILIHCRQFIAQEESDIEHLEQRLEKIIKLCTIAVDSGKEYVKNQRYTKTITHLLLMGFYNSFALIDFSAFAMSLWDLQQHFSGNKNAHNALGKLIHCLQVKLIKFNEFF